MWTRTYAYSAASLSHEKRNHMLTLLRDHMGASVWSVSDLAHIHPMALAVLAVLCGRGLVPVAAQVPVAAPLAHGPLGGSGSGSGNRIGSEIGSWSRGENTVGTKRARLYRKYGRAGPKPGSGPGPGPGHVATAVDMVWRDSGTVWLIEVKKAQGASAPAGAPLGAVRATAVRTPVRTPAQAQAHAHAQAGELAKMRGPLAGARDSAFMRHQAQAAVAEVLFRNTYRIPLQWRIRSAVVRVALDGTHFEAVPPSLVAQCQRHIHAH
jgi:hypothetical protein